MSNIVDLVEQELNQVVDPPAAEANVSNTNAGPTSQDSEIEKIKEATGNKFTSDEIKNFMNMGKIFAAKPVLHALKAVIEEGPALGKSKSTCNKLCKCIDNLMPYDYAGYMQIEFNETIYKLNISLTIVPRDYVARIDIPSKDYLKELSQNIHNLVNLALAYWQQFMEDNPDLISKIVNYRDDVDFSKLAFENKLMPTLYWDEKCFKRVGILCYYVDANGRPLAK